MRHVKVGLGEALGCLQEDPLPGVQKPGKRFYPLFECVKMGVLRPSGKVDARDVVSPLDKPLPLLLGKHPVGGVDGVRGGSVRKFTLRGPAAGELVEWRSIF